MRSVTYKQLEKNISYFFRDKELLINALVHRSALIEYKLNRKASNERLEFLGDAILEAKISHYLYEKMNESSEGDMSKKRSEMVCEKSLAFCAKRINLGEYILLSNGEEKSGGKDKESILSDAFEALIAAIYLDSDFDTASEFIEEYVIKPQLNKHLYIDYKSRFQELFHKSKYKTIEYKLVKECGPEHDKKFTVNLLLDNEFFSAGTNKSIKAAEQDAAKIAINKIS